MAEPKGAVSVSFESAWDTIQRRMQPGTNILNWGLSRGETGGTFRIEALDRSSITVFGGKMRMPRRVSRGDFKKIYASWDAYLAGKVSRSDMTPLSQNSTYILSILNMVGQDAK